MSQILSLLKTRKFSFLYTHKHTDEKNKFASSKNVAFSIRFKGQGVINKYSTVGNDIS
jgi:hypothetical protein